MMKEAHVLAIPVPLQGHITPMLNLCCKLAPRGCDKITFLINEDKLETLQKLQRALEDNGDLPKGVVSAEVIPVTLPPAFTGGNDQIRRFMRAAEAMSVPTEAVALRILATSELPVSCVLSDVQFGWTQDIANKIGVPRVALWITVLAEFAIILHMPTLIAEGTYDPLEGKKDPMKLIRVPGLPPLRPSEIPQVSQYPDVLKDYWDYCLRQMGRIYEAKLVLINSCYDFEKDTYNELVTKHKIPVRFAGPLLSSTTSSTGGDHAAKSKCLQWLDGQAPRSVIYVAFGSFLQMPSSQVEEIFLGIEASQEHFLLVFRMDMLVDQPSPALTAFLERFSGTHDEEGSCLQQGLVVAWAPQQDVLFHPSTGGFFTHYGWNSMVESISAGVPMIGKPLLGDQLVIRRLAIEQWKIALEIEEAEDGTLSRSDVERAVKALMQSQELRVNAEVLKKCLHRTLNEGGDSYQCWDVLARVVSKP